MTNLAAYLRSVRRESCKIKTFSLRISQLHRSPMCMWWIALTSGGLALQERTKQRRSPDHRVPAPLGEGWNDRRSFGTTVGLEQPLNRSHPDVRQIDGPYENGAGLQGLQGAQRDPQ